MREQIRFTMKLMGTNFRSMLALRGSFFMQVVFMFLNNFLFAVIWWVLFQRYETIGGWNLYDMLALYGTTAMAFGIFVTQFGGSRDLARVICSGELDSYLTQPRSILQQVCTRHSVAMG